MRFPKQAQQGQDGPADARHRLEEAQSQELEMEDAHEGSKTTSGEPAAASALSAARERTAAREAWVAWVERDY